MQCRRAGNAVAGTGDADGDRQRNRSIPNGGKMRQRRARPGCARHFKEGASLGRRLQKSLFRPQPRSYDYPFPRKKLLGALRSALAAKLADGKLTVVDSLEIKEGKTKLYFEALNKLGVSRTALLVENGKTLAQVAGAGARNLQGVELVLNNEVHPYDLLRYDRAIFSKAAIEQLSEVLEKTASNAREARKAAAEKEVA